MSCCRLFEDKNSLPCHRKPIDEWIFPAPCKKSWSPSEKKKKKSQKTNTRYSLHQSLIIYLKYIKRIYLSFQMRKIYCSLCWWDCIPSMHSSKWVSWQEQWWVWDVIMQTVLPFRAPALPTTDAASGHHFTDTCSARSPPEQWRCSPASWGCKKPISTSRYKNGK